MTNGHKDYGSATATCVKFVTAGAGRNLCVKNHAASAWNRESTAVTVFYKSNWAGAIDAIVAGARANLTLTKNQNAGHVVGEAANNRMVGALYDAPGGRITSYFDGYLNTNGRHEGIDIAKGIGSPVHALLGGHVTRVTEGATGGNGLSQIAVYNATLDRTIVYLHTNPRNALNAGDFVDRGPSSAPRAGAGSRWNPRPTRMSRCASAGVRVRPTAPDDPVLDNPIPTEFWMNHGYNICCT